ncbi:hypothetical protein NL676_010360 [Syzygium grande]|nr:hypothetical protein NL676_010360 [Syzygium grande]
MDSGGPPPHFGISRHVDNQEVEYPLGDDRAYVKYSSMVWVDEPAIAAVRAHNSTTNFAGPIVPEEQLNSDHISISGLTSEYLRRPENSATSDRISLAAVQRASAPRPTLTVSLSAKEIKAEVLSEGNTVLAEKARELVNFSEPHREGAPLRPHYQDNQLSQIPPRLDVSWSTPHRPMP